MADEKKKAADLRRIAELLQKDDELDGTFRQHYGGQAEQLEKKGIVAWLYIPVDRRRVILDYIEVRDYSGEGKTTAAALEELPQLLAEKEKWERRYHELAGAAIQLPFKASADRLLLDGLRKIIAELAALKRPLRLCQPGRAEHLIDAAAKLLEPAEKTPDTEQREWEEKERAAAFSRKVTGCKSCPFSGGVAGEWCRRYNRFNPPHELEAWGRPEWCEPGDIVITIEETEIEDDLGDRRVNYTGGEKK